MSPTDLRHQRGLSTIEAVAVIATVAIISFLLIPILRA